MPRKKSWIPKITHILKHLEADGSEYYTRKMVEELFEVGASQAAELMQVAGLSAVSRPGAGSLVYRLNLLAYVKNSPEAREALQEEERRQRLAAKLKSAEEDLRLRSISIPVAPADEWTGFRELPSVSFDGRALRIEFEDAKDLLRKLWLLSRAMANDFGGFERMCEHVTAPSESAGPLSR